MTNTLPPHIIPRRTPSSGTGLFTSQPIDAGELVFRVERPLITVLDSARLSVSCEWCLAGGKRDGDGVDGGGWEGEGTVRPSACTGCRIVRYCSKTCQSRSWRHAHKHTCPIYKRLYPKVLPNTVRAILELLVRRSTRTLPDAEWQAFMEVQSHIDDFRRQREKNEDGLTTWQTIELMGQAAMSYSGTREPLALVQEITARILTNTHTLTTPTLDPLGLSLSLPSSRLNHSCTPNTCITFSGPVLSLRTLTPISADTELTISYIDTTLPTPLRRAELMDRYFFACVCEACSTAPGKEEEKQQFPHSVVQETGQLLSTAKNTSEARQAYPLLARALRIIEACTPKRVLHIYPSPSIRNQMMPTALSLQHWDVALKMALQGYGEIDPMLFPQAWHPVRVVHAWVLLRLVVQVAEMGLSVGGSSGGGGGDVKWHLIILKLWKEIDGTVDRSHGMESAFANEVRAFGAQMGEGWGRFVGELGEEVAERTMREELGRLRGRLEGVGFGV